MPNNPHTKKRGSPKSYMKKMTLSQARAAGAMTTLSSGTTTMLSFGAAATSSSGTMAMLSAGMDNNSGVGEAGVAVAVHNGWSPILAVVSAGTNQEKRVLAVVGWEAATGNPPYSHTVYLGGSGFVSDPNEASDIRGS